MEKTFDAWTAWCVSSNAATLVSETHRTEPINESESLTRGLNSVSNNIPCECNEIRGNLSSNVESTTKAMRRDMRESLMDSATWEDQKEARRESARIRQKKSRLAATESKRMERRQHDKSYRVESRANETPEETRARKAADKAYTSESRANETREETRARKAADKAYTSESRANETREETRARLDARKAYTSKSRANETREETRARLDARKAYMSESRANETREETLARKAADKAYTSESRANETPEETLARKAADKAYTSKSLANETREETMARLDAKKACMAKFREKQKLYSEQRRIDYDESLESDLDIYLQQHPELPSRTRRDRVRAEEARIQAIRSARAAERRRRNRARRMADPAFVAEAVRTGAPSCDVHDHLNYATGTGIDPFRHDVQEILDRLPDYTITGIREAWARAKILEQTYINQMFHVGVCACCSKLRPMSEMKVGITEDYEPDVLLPLVSEISDRIKYPTMVRLAGGVRYYAIDEMYEGKPDVNFCACCYGSLCLDPPRVPDCSVKTIDIGPWPTLTIDGVKTPFKSVTIPERLAMSPVTSTKYMTTGYDVASGKTNVPGQLSGHITAFASPPPSDVADALGKHYPKSIQEMGENIQIILVTADTPEEARAKARNLTGMTVDGFWLNAWCEHLSKIWNTSNIEEITVRHCILL